MNQKYLDKLEQLDWVVNESESWIELENTSPAGEDFIFSVSADNFVDDIKEYAANFDPDEHIEMWVTAKHNGGKDIPSIRELVEDADAIDKMLQELAIAMCEVRNEIERDTRINAGYTIVESCAIDDELEVVLGERRGKYVTWRCRNGEDYYWGHYFDDPRAALKDYGKRIMEEADD